MPVNALDIIIVIPVLIFLVSGLKSGFVEQVIGLAGQLVAIFLAFTHMGDLSGYLERVFNTESAWVPFLSFILLYLLVIMVVKALINVLHSVLKLAQLSMVNHVFGGIFGALKGALLVSVVLILISVFGQPAAEYKQESLLYGYVLPVAPVTYDLLSNLYPGVSGFSEQVGDYFRNADIPGLLNGEPDTEAQ